MTHTPFGITKERNLMTKNAKENTEKLELPCCWDCKRAPFGKHWKFLIKLNIFLP